MYFEKVDNYGRVFGGNYCNSESFQLLNHDALGFLFTQLVLQFKYSQGRRSNARARGQNFGGGHLR